MSGVEFPPILTDEQAREAAERELEVWSRTGGGSPTVTYGPEVAQERADRYNAIMEGKL